MLSWYFYSIHSTQPVVRVNFIQCLDRVTFLALSIHCRCCTPKFINCSCSVLVYALSINVIYLFFLHSRRRKKILSKSCRPSFVVNCTKHAFAPCKNRAQFVILGELCTCFVVVILTSNVIDNLALVNNNNGLAPSVCFLGPFY